MSAGGFWRRLASLTRKEVRQLVRDRSNLLIGIGLPIALILIFGYGLSLDVKRAIVAIVLDDPSPWPAMWPPGSAAPNTWSRTWCVRSPKARS